MFFSKFAECFTLFLVMMLDLVFTLACQPSHYWHNYEHLDELSPMGSMLLLLGPDRFLAAFLLYGVLILYFGVVRLPRQLGHSIFIGFLLAHSWGSVSWLPKFSAHVLLLEINKWYLCCGYFAAIALVYGFCLYLSRQSKQSTDLL